MLMPPKTDANRRLRPRDNMVNIQPPHAASGFDRDRELDEQRHRALHPEEIARREREMERDRGERERDRDRDEADRQHRESYPPTAPHHSSTGSIPIHQPVASRISTSITGPGGLLSNHGSSAPSMPMSGPSAPGPSYSSSLHSEPSRPSQHGGPGTGSAPQQHQMFAPMSHGPNGPNSSLGGSGASGSMFGGPLPQENNRGLPQEPSGVRSMQQMPYNSTMGGGHSMPPGPGGMPQGQQPILNVRTISQKAIRCESS